MGSNEAMDDYRNKKSIEFVYAISEVNKLLREIRRPFLQSTAKEVVKGLDVVSAFPNFDKNNPFDLFKQQELESMATAIYCAEPKVFSNLNKEQKGTFVRLLDLTIQSGEVDSLFNIVRLIAVPPFRASSGASSRSVFIYCKTSVSLLIFSKASRTK